MQRYYKANEVAKLFEIPVSTLHYWESIGLFEIPRNEENGYREYTLSDIFIIWEIMLYRELDVPVKEVREVLDSDMEVLDKIYTANEKSIDAQIAALKKKKQKIKVQKELIKKLAKLKEQPLCESVPDFTICKKDIFGLESIRTTLADPYQCVMYIEDCKTQQYVRGIALPPKENEEVLWEWKEGVYLEFLLTMNFHDLSDNNLSEIMAQIEKKGYQTGEIIARYLLVATEGKRRLEYSQAWVQVNLSK